MKVTTTVRTSLLALGQWTLNNMGTYGKLMQNMDSDLGVTTEIKSFGEPERAKEALEARLCGECRKNY